MEPEKLPGAPQLGKTGKTIKLTHYDDLEPDSLNSLKSTEPIKHSEDTTPTKSTESLAPITDQPHTEEDQWQEPDELNEHWEDPGDPDGVFAESQKQQWLEAQRNRPQAPVVKQKKSKPRWPIAVLLIIAIVGILGITYKYALHRSPSVAPKNTTTIPATQTTQNTATSTQANTPTTTTKQYSAKNFTLSLEYPDTWNVSETTAKVMVVSPSVQLTQADGKNVSGHVIMSIQNQQTTVAGYPAAGATATRASDRVSYKQPTQVQRAQTYISYLGFKDASGLDAIYVTGDNGYQQGQQIPLADIIKGNPLISIGFSTCTSNDCSTATPLSVASSAWIASTEQTQVTNLITSLQLQ